MSACVCGHAVEEHGHDPEYPGSTACMMLTDDDEDCDCLAYEAAEDDDETADGQ